MVRLSVSGDCLCKKEFPALDTLSGEEREAIGKSPLLAPEF